MSRLPDLDDLIARVERRSDQPDPLARLEAAVRIANELGSVSDALVDHFVNEARDADLSWTQIGACLGVSKQAAQQQYVLPVPEPERGSGRGHQFGRYSPRARRAIRRAVRAAQATGASFVDTEHLLLGIIDLGEGVAAKVLADIKPLDEWAKAVTAAVTPAPARRVRGRLPFTPQAREAVARASVEAAKLGHPFIGTEHQLLALINVDGAASRVLVDGGATDERVRDDIVKLLGNALPSRPQAATQAVDDTGDDTGKGEASVG